MIYPTPADRFFTAMLAILLLCAVSFYAGRETAPVRTRTEYKYRTRIRYLPAPVAAPPPRERRSENADGGVRVP